MKRLLIGCALAALTAAGATPSKAEGFALLLVCELDEENGPAVIDFQASAAFNAFCADGMEPNRICQATAGIAEGMTCATAATMVAGAGAKLASIQGVAPPHPGTKPLLVIAEDVEGEAAATQNRVQNGLLYINVHSVNGAVGIVGCSFHGDNGALATTVQGPDDGALGANGDEVACADALQGELDQGRQMQSTVAVGGGDRRFKLSNNNAPLPEDRSPFPKDRVVFNYHHFTNALP